jgi:CheY-like chemotaxis protein
MTRFNAASRNVSLLIAALGLGLAGAAQAEAVAAPAPPPAHCVLLVGGGIPVTPDPKVNAFWLAVNRVLSADIQTDLALKGYVVDGMVADSPDRDQRLAAVTKQLVQDGCEKAVQVSIALTGAADKPDVTSAFEFGIMVFHLNITDVPGKAMKSVRIAGDYSKSYTYPLTTAVMDKLSMITLSAQIASDLDDAKVLPLAK